MNEANRLKELYTYHILDTKPEKELNELAEVASLICNTPISMITLVDKYRTWHKVKNGMDMDEVKREDSFCQHVICNSGDVFVVEDAAYDSKFTDNPYVKMKDGIRFYAGAPLVTPKGNVLGSLCVVDTIPKKITERQKQALQVLSKKAMDYLNTRKLILLQKNNIELSAIRLKKLTDEAPCAIFQLHRSKVGNLTFEFLSKGIHKIHPDLKVNNLKKNPKLLFDIIVNEDLPFVMESLENSHKNLTEWNIAYRLKTKDKSSEWHMLMAVPEVNKKSGIIWYGTIQNITNLIEYEKTIEQILFDISHVLRRPISSLMGLINCMQEEKKHNESQFKEYSTYLKMASDELDDFTRTLNHNYLLKNKILSHHTRNLPKAGK